EPDSRGLERRGLGALKAEDRLFAVADGEHRTDALVLRPCPGEKLFGQRRDDRPLARIRVLRLVDQYMVGTLVELEANPFAELAEPQQRPRDRDQIIEIGEPARTLRHR